MKAVLICPSDRPAVPNLAAQGPLATLPILGDCIVNHWVEHLATLGAKDIEIIVPRGAEAVREIVGDGARWGVAVRITFSGREPLRDEVVSRLRSGGEPGWLPPPFDVVVMNHLPACPDLPLFESYASWFAALIGWLPNALTPTRIRVGEAGPGIWIGKRSHVSPGARLVAPCWVGDHVPIEDGAVVGPEAVIEDRCVVDEKARVSSSWVGPDTFVGPLTSVGHSLAWGSTLTDWRSESSLRVPDPFLLGSLTGADSPRRSSSPVRAEGRSTSGQLQIGFFASLRARLSGG
jgi:NDP-sugar pyrophosphorylase family protein